MRRLAAAALLAPVAFVFILALAVSMGGLDDPDEAVALPVARAVAGIPARALSAEVEAPRFAPCPVDWRDIAAVLENELKHGYGAAGGVQYGLDENGRLTPALQHWDNGNNSMGPAQISPGLWERWGVDADEDGAADPQDIDDAAATVGRILCSMGYRPDDLDARRAAFGGYNGGPAGWAAKPAAVAYAQRALVYAASLPLTPAPGAAASLELGLASGDSPHGPIPLATVGGITVHAGIAPNLAALLDHAYLDGVERLAGWGYRSHASQIALRSANGCPDTYRAPASTCRVPTARPGSSMHEQGLAVDFTVRGSIIASRSDPAFRWLAENAARYGFYNLPSEPWHWSLNGR